MLFLLQRSLKRCVVQYGRRYYSKGPVGGDKVVVAMSGGVDSSVTAGLLAKANKFNLEAVFMRNWDTRDESGTEQGCEWERDWVDVQRVCQKLSIPARMIDLSREYWTRVFEPSLKTWEKGWTPNPDVWCNKEIKFGALLNRLQEKVDENGKTPWLATGHYARKDYQLSSDTQLPRLLPHPSSKDQTYYLSSIRLSSLDRTIFPLGNSPLSLSAHNIEKGDALNKDLVRVLAKEWELHTAEKEESMGVCFVGEKRRFGEFVSQYIPPAPGDIVHLRTGKVLGTHDGVWNYTIGQGAKLSGLHEKLFVTKKDPLQRKIFVAPWDHPALSIYSLSSTDFKWIWPKPPSEIFTKDDEKGMEARVKVRHKGESIPAFVKASTDPHGSIIVTLQTPEKGVSQGQVVAVYDAAGKCCLGCGTIEQIVDEEQKEL